MLTNRTQGCVGASRPARVKEVILNTKGFVMQFVKPLLALALLATPAAALEPLSKEKYVNDRLIAARIADRVRRSCPSIDGRLIFAYSEARRLERYAPDRLCVPGHQHRHRRPPEPRDHAVHPRWCHPDPAVR